MSKSYYRPEVDGLRAIAVLAVLVYHLKISIGEGNILPGGFLGVDIFFVISGYLITSILVREFNKDAFTFRDFYDRRARRILPVLMLVSALSIPFALSRLLPAALQDYAYSIISSQLFASNIWFWTGDSYWAADSSLRPFLHTWSLGIEEQFYLIMPILLLLMWRYAKNHLSIFFGILFIASLALAEFAAIQDPQSGFYLLPFRAWELLSGAGLAWLEYRGLGAKNGGIGRVLPGIGLLAIFATFLLFTSETKHPSTLTFIPILGTVFIIRYSSSEDWATRLLQTRVLVAIGLISYSLYLWHFPIFAFEFTVGRNTLLSHKLISLGLTFLLAYLCYRLFETPCRDKSKIPHRVFYPAILVTLISLVSVSALIIHQKGLPNRFADYSGLLAYEEYDFESHYLSHRCFLHPEDMAQANPFDACPRSNGNAGAKKILLWGDSAAAHLIPGFVDRFGSTHDLIFRTSSGCGAFIGYDNPKRPGCKDINDDVFQLIQSESPDLVVIAGWWQEKYQHLQHLEQTLQKLQTLPETQVVIIGPVPNWQLSLPRTLLQYGQRNPHSANWPEFLQDDFHRQQFTIEKELQRLTGKYQTDYISAMSVLCNAQGCKTHLEPQIPMQWDAFHLTREGAIHLVSTFPDSDIFRKSLSSD